MKACTICKADKDDSEFYRGTIKADGSYGLVGACKPCHSKRANESKRDRDRADPAKARAYSKSQYAKHKVKNNECSRKYHEENRDAHNAQMRDNRKNNLDGYRLKDAKYNMDNPKIKAAQTKRRRQSIKQRTPIWTQRDKIREVHRMAKVWTRRLGVRMEVDHVAPLNGLDVSGLHCWENLQIVSEEINRAKHRGHYPNGYPTINYLT